VTLQFIEAGFEALDLVPHLHGQGRIPEEQNGKLNALLIQCSPYLIYMISQFFQRKSHEFTASVSSGRRWTGESLRQDAAQLRQTW